MKGIREKYEELVEKCERFERKGKTMPYTSANGHMFSQINKDDQLGIRFDKKRQEALFEELNTSYFKSYGATMNGYILIPDELWNDMDKLTELLNEGYDFVMSLDPK